MLERRKLPCHVWTPLPDNLYKVPDKLSSDPGTLLIGRVWPNIQRVQRPRCSSVGFVLPLFCTYRLLLWFCGRHSETFILWCEGWKHNKHKPEVQFYISRYNKVWANITTDNRPAPLHGLLWRLVISQIISAQHTYIVFCAGLFLSFPPPLS